MEICLASYPVVGQLAQSVEQGTENPRVGGSIPSLPTTFFAACVLDQNFFDCSPAEVEFFGE
jgi:hypothetical protein